MLDDYVAAAQASYRAAQGQPLSKKQLRAGIKQHRAALDNFNRYLGIDEKELINTYRRTARKVVAKISGKSMPNVAHSGRLRFVKSAFTVG